MKIGSRVLCLSKQEHVHVMYNIFMHMQAPTHGNEIHTSFRISLLAPLRTMVQALGLLHSTRYVKYSSPIFRTSNKPQPVPTSDSLSSSVRLQITAPTALQSMYTPELENKYNICMLITLQSYYCQSFSLVVWQWCYVLARNVELDLQSTDKTINHTQVWGQTCIHSIARNCLH